MAAVAATKSMRARPADLKRAFVGLNFMTTNSFQFPTFTEEAIVPLGIAATDFARR
jgi:hypothetical protein